MNLMYYIHKSVCVCVNVLFWDPVLYASIYGHIDFIFLTVADDQRFKQLP